MIFFLLLLVLVFVAQIVELFVPPLGWLHNAHVMLVPVIVFYGAMALPFSLMLALAVIAFAANAMQVTMTRNDGTVGETVSVPHN